MNTHIQTFSEYTNVVCIQKCDVEDITLLLLHTYQQPQVNSYSFKFQVINLSLACISIYMFQHSAFHKQIQVNTINKIRSLH